MSNFQKPFLLDSGLSLEKIALLSSLMLLPFSVKIIFAWISDSFSFLGDHRKSYMLVGLFLAGTSYFYLAFINPGEHFYLFLAILICSATGMALFDSCADGLGVDLSLNNDEGRIQSSMMLGRGLGYILLSLLFGLVITKSGYSMIFLIISGIIGAVFLYTYLYCPQIKDTQRTNKRSSWDNIKFYLKSNGKSFLTLTLLGILYSITLYGVDGIITLYAKIDLKMTEKEIGYLGALQGIGSVVGALCTLLLLRFLGTRKAAYFSVALISISGIFLLQTSNIHLFYVLGFVWGTAWAVQETVFLTLSTKVAHGPVGATIFATLMMASNIGVSIGEGIATQMVDIFSAGSTILYLSIAHLLALFLVALFFMHFNNQTAKN